MAGLLLPTAHVLLPLLSKPKPPLLFVCQICYEHTCPLKRVRGFKNHTPYTLTTLEATRHSSGSSVTPPPPAPPSSCCLPNTLRPPPRPGAPSKCNRCTCCHGHTNPRTHTLHPPPLVLTQQNHTSHLPCPGSSSSSPPNPHPAAACPAGSCTPCEPPCRWRQ
jgi:hypothetical protein